MWAQPLLMATQIQVPRLQSSRYSSRYVPSYSHCGGLTPLIRSLWGKKKDKERVVPDRRQLQELRENLLRPQADAAAKAARRSNRVLIRSDCDFEQIFTEADAEAKECMKECVKESSLKNLHCMAKIVDNLLTHLDDTKYQQLASDNDRLLKDVLGTPGGARLIELSGFTLKLGHGEKDGAAYVWNAEGPERLVECKFRTMVLRAAITRVLAIARTRGTRKWTMGQMEYLPVEYQLRPSELLIMKRSTDEDNSSFSSKKEMYLENQIKVGLSKIRPLHYSDIATTVCRQYADRRRQYYRQHSHDAMGNIEEVNEQDLIGMMEQTWLPPGIEFAHFHWNGQLPHTFGMKSTSGVQNQVDLAMEQISQDVIKSWQVLYAEDMKWEQSSIMGVGVALDYAANMGFVCGIFAGFPFGETLPP